MESKSTDGGQTWSPAQKVNDSPAGVAAFTPSVDVNASGDVAVTFYDFRNDTPTPTPRSRTTGSGRPATVGRRGRRSR